MSDTRTFCASFSVRIDTRRVRFELSPARLHGGPGPSGGPEGLFRVRLDRRWLDTPEGATLFFDREQLAGLVVEAALGNLPEPQPAPDIPLRSRVTVRLMRDGEPYNEGGWTLTPPILAASGGWMVAVTLFDGVTFVPVDSLTLARRAA